MIAVCVLLRGGGGVARAQTVVAVPAVPLLPAAPLPTGPLSRSLGGAYQAINAARATDPGAALRATFLLTQARQRAQRGDVAGALADSAAAQAAALMPVGVPVIPAGQGVPAAPAFPGADFSGGAARLSGAGGASPAQPTLEFPRRRAGSSRGAVPLVEHGATLSVDLFVARNEIELVERLRPGAPLAAAKKHYRAGLGAYLGGNAARATREANAAFDAAEALLEKER